MTEFEQQLAQTGSHLTINPFGPAILYYNGQELTDTNEPTRYAIGTPDFKFLIRVNLNGTIDIQRKEGVSYNVNIETNQRICQLRVAKDEVTLPPWYTLFGDRLIQNFSLRSAEFRDANFRVMLLNSKMFRRLDFRFQRSSWATVIVYDHKLLKVGLHGDREMAMWDTACNEIHADGVTRENEAAGGSMQFGLTDERPRRNRSASVSTVGSSREYVHQNPTGPADMNANTAPILNPSGGNPGLAPTETDSMPLLVPRNHAELEQIRITRITELRAALAALQAESFAVLPDITE